MFSAAENRGRPVLTFFVRVRELLSPLFVRFSIVVFGNINSMSSLVSEFAFCFLQDVSPFGDSC